MARKNKVTRLYFCELCSASVSITGSGRPRKYCDPCKPKAQSAQWRARYVPSSKPKPIFPERRDYIKKIKLSCQGCVDCGFEMNERTIVCFDFDHRDPSIKRFELSNPPKWVTQQDVDDEIAKCDIVCRNCHALRPTSRLGRYRRPQVNQLPIGNLFDIAQ